MRIIKSLTDNFTHNLSFSSLCHEISDKIQLIVNDMENTIGVKFAEVDNQLHPIKYISVSNGKLISWYKPICFQGALNCVRFISTSHMYLLGFNKNVLEDGVIIWTKFNENNVESLIFAPCCIGGITFYQHFLKMICNKFPKKNIYILEIPGMAWTTYSSELPPSISKVSSIVCKFIVQTTHSTNMQIDLFGHSFGTIVLNHIVNEQYDYMKKSGIKIDKIIYIEGLLFYINVFKTLETIEMPLLDVLLGKNKNDIFTMPLFQRDLHVKFYIKRYLSLSNSVLCGDTQCESECKFYALMANDDNKFITQDYVDYIEKKKINIKYKIFNNCTHGAFIWTNEMQNYFVDIITN